MNFDGAKDAAAIVFSDTYLGARNRFLKAAPTSNAYPHVAKGPLGEELFTDVAYFGRRDAKNLLILVSGTHGPEGYCGSAAQLLFLQAGFHNRLPPSTAVLLVHALNCYGFAWDLRSTAEGCDLDRNFVDFDKPLPPNPEYEELVDYLVPADITPNGIRRADEAIAAYRSRHGEQKFWEARVSGQYTRPGGMFYGGKASTEARRTLEQITVDFDVASRDSVLIISYQTGEGKYGYGELTCGQRSGRTGYKRAIKIFGRSAASIDLGTPWSVALHGSQDAFWQSILNERQTYVELRFGTYHDPAIVRNEHWLLMHRPEAVDWEVGRHIRHATRAHFYPQRCDWKEMVVWRSHIVHRQALEALVE